MGNTSINTSERVDIVTQGYDRREKSMHLTKLQIKNFRAFDDQIIHFLNYTTLLGQNGVGKSTVLAALNILFRNTTGSSTDVISLQEEDFHYRNTGEPIVITATFDSLSDEAKDDFRHYVRNERLIITAKATWDLDNQVASVLQYGARLQVPKFREYFEADEAGASAIELRERYVELRSSYPGLSRETVKANMHQALIDYGESHPEECDVVESQDQFYGWSRGVNRLAKYIQWVFVPAVKEATSEQQEAKNTALGDLLQRTIRASVSFDESLEQLRTEALERYDEILVSNQEALGSLQEALQARLRKWAHPNASLELLWNQESSRAITVNEPFAHAIVGEAEFMGELSRLGHGLQRSFIISILQELATHAADQHSTLILGIEEPELYQHPPQARHFARVLEELANSGSQVIVTTHSPLFVSAKDLESIRLLSRSRNTGNISVKMAKTEEVTTRLEEALGESQPAPNAFLATMEQILRPSMAELFFSGIPVLVEGIEDVAILAAYIQSMGNWSEFRQHGFHFVVCDGKTNLSRPLAIALTLEMPVFVIFDGDANESKDETRHQRDNECLLKLCGCVLEDELQKDDYWGTQIVMWRDDIQSSITRALGGTVWRDAIQDARVRNDLEEGVKEKNVLLLAATVDEVNKAGIDIPPLEKLTRNLFDYAEAVIE